MYNYSISEGCYEDYTERNLTHTTKYTLVEYQKLVKIIQDSLYNHTNKIECFVDDIVEVMIRDYGFQEVKLNATCHLWDYPVKVK